MRRQSSDDAPHISRGAEGDCSISQCTVPLAPSPRRHVGDRRPSSRSAVAAMDGATKLVCSDILKMVWVEAGHGGVRRDGMICDGGSVVWRGEWGAVVWGDG